MPVIPVALDDIKEMRPVAMGKYALTIAQCDEVTSKKGKPQYDISISIDGHDDAPNMRHFISLPAEGDEEKAFKFKTLMLKRFCSLFGKPLTGSSIDTTKLAMSLAGARAVAEVTLDKETDSEGHEKPNGRVFNRLSVPFLPDEGSTGRVAPPPPKS